MENIDKIIYINLDRRLDRKQEIAQEFDKMNISEEKIIRFSAINNKLRPEVGCTESHLEVLKLAKKNNYNNILILEDDFTFLVNKDKLNELLNNFFNSKIEYDVLMLSYHLKGEQLPYNKLIGKGVNIRTASGYIVNKKFYDKLIDNLSKALDLLKPTKKHWLYMNDQYWKKLQPISDWFYFLERIGKQRKSYSNLGLSIADYGC